LTIQTTGKAETLERLPLAAAVAAFERDVIQDALTTARGNAAEAARLLRTTARVMNYKIKQLKIDSRRFKVSTLPDPPSRSSI